MSASRVLIGNAHVPLDGVAVQRLLETADFAGMGADDSVAATLDVTEARRRLEEYGYVLLRHLLPRDVVERAHAAVLEEVSRVVGPARAARGEGSPMLSAFARTSGAVRAMVEHPRLFEITALLADGPTLTFAYKWLRAVGRDAYSSPHCDRVFMGRGSHRLMTCWLPFHDVPVERGGLAVIPGSHCDAAYSSLRATYGRMDVDTARPSTGGAITTDPLEVTSTFGGRWATADYDAGDVLVFLLDTIHCSLHNQTDYYRVSCDVRFQPAADPIDDRWAGDEPVGHEPLGSGQPAALSEEECRWEWGLAISSRAEG